MNRLLAIACLCALSAFAAPGPSPAPMPPPLPTTDTVAPLPPALPQGMSAPSATMPQPTKQSAPTPMPKPTPVVSAASPAAAPEVAIPQPFPRSRYETSWKKNPFLLKTAPVIQKQVSWSEDFALTSIAKMSGVHRVSIKNKKTGESKRLSDDANADAEFKIVKVNLLPDRKSSSVEIEKGGEKATLTYDLTMAAPQGRGAVPGQPGGARPGMPVIPGQPGGNIPLPNVRTSATSGQRGGQPAMASAAGSYQRTPTAGGGNMPAPSYTGNTMGNTGGYIGGGGFAGGGAAGTANTTTNVGGNTGVASNSRLGALAPRSGTGGATQNGLVPVAGGTAMTTVSGNVTTTGTATSTADTTISVDANGTLINSADPLANPDTTGTTTTPVTRRRTLIPAPVIPQ